MRIAVGEDPTPNTQYVAVYLNGIDISCGLIAVDTKERMIVRQVFDAQGNFVREPFGRDIATETILLSPVSRLSVELRNGAPPTVVEWFEKKRKEDR